jgi:hypothetical protein
VTQNSGGVSFDISPKNATVYVDGAYVGVAESFSPTSRPLILTPGQHHLEVRLSGYQTMAVEVNVQAGQVIPYQGTMQPQH